VGDEAGDAFIDIASSLEASVFGDVDSRTLFLDLWIAFSGLAGVDMDGDSAADWFGGGSSLTGDSLALDAIISAATEETREEGMKRKKLNMVQGNQQMN
jgi:hypothetical protein